MKRRAPRHPRGRESSRGARRSPTCHVRSSLNSLGSILPRSAPRQRSSLSEIVRDLEAEIIRLASAASSRSSTARASSFTPISAERHSAPTRARHRRNWIGYNNLEYDLATGARGSRAGYLENSLALLCGSEAATVVNNCAAALVLIVRHFTQAKTRSDHFPRRAGPDRRRISDRRNSRSERRAPARSWHDEQDRSPRLCESDWSRNRPDPEGASEQFFHGRLRRRPSTEEIATLARTKRIPFVEDLGSGAVVATEKLGLADHEPTPSETLKRGVDLVCFSGDKFLGGPQAGIIAGKARFIRALKREPLFRALRCDKLVFAALAATVEAHLRDDWRQLPVLRCSRFLIGELRARGEKLIDRLRGLSLDARLVASKARDRRRRFAALGHSFGCPRVRLQQSFAQRTGDAPSSCRPADHRLSRARPIPTRSADDFPRAG